MSDVIVVIPGILGSRLRRGDDVLWGLSPALLGKALLRRPQKIGDALMPFEGDGVVADAVLPNLQVLPGVWKVCGYTKLAQLLERTFAQRAEIVTFPYDWRQDNRRSGERLAAAAESWLSAAGSDAELVIVAHSMGGLVARYYLEVLGGWRRTRALITYGTPHRGAPKALDALIHGVAVKGMQLPGLTPFARALPSLHQLLPFYPCFDEGDGALRRLDEVQLPHGIDPALFRDAKSFHGEMREAARANPTPLSERYLFMPIVGVGQHTAQIARREGAEVEMRPEYPGQPFSGDGTVPDISATPVAYSNQGLERYTGAKHCSLQNSDTVLTQTSNSIRGLDIDQAAFDRKRVSHSVGLEVAYLYEADEPITVGIELIPNPAADREPQPIDLSIRVTGDEGGPEVAWQQARLEPGQPQRLSLPDLTPGAYQVELMSPLGDPVLDSFLVAADG